MRFCGKILFSKNSLSWICAHTYFSQTQLQASQSLFSLLTKTIEDFSIIESIIVIKTSKQNVIKQEAQHQQKRKEKVDGLTEVTSN